MKISFSWLNDYLLLDRSTAEIASMLTHCGLEVESIEEFSDVKGGLRGLIIGEVIEKSKHPNADKLSVTKVNVGNGSFLQIVCGASNVEAGQKVIVATEGATLFPIKGDPFLIKKTKIRGEVSEGMICAEDEIGLGTSHEGIIVLKPEAQTGIPVSDYYKIQSDYVFEIGLTPNRTDAFCHIGVARDLSAVLNRKARSEKSGKVYKLCKPTAGDFSIDNESLNIPVEVIDTENCIRYSGISITGVKVEPSPTWLQAKLKAIGQKPINNIVDITNFVNHEMGQPLHAFDADKISGKKIIVKQLSKGTKFTTLDSVERVLSGNELMICDEAGGLVIAGVFGGVRAEVSDSTKNIFLESACFRSSSIRNTSKAHGLHTDASFRFERGTDPNITVEVLKRAATLIREIAGGKISSQIVDVYPEKQKEHELFLKYEMVNRVSGIRIDPDEIKNILADLEIKIVSDTNEGVHLNVPLFRMDVKREIDVIEEIIRIYGYDQVPDLPRMATSLPAFPVTDRSAAENKIASFLAAQGFTEILTNSLTNPEYFSEVKNHVEMANALSRELSVMRPGMLATGLEAIQYNLNRQNSDLRFFEFGKTYSHSSSGKNPFIEKNRAAIYLTGSSAETGWKKKEDKRDIYYLKSVVQNVLIAAGTGKNIRFEEFHDDELSMGLKVFLESQITGTMGAVSRKMLKRFDIKEEIFYAEVDMDVVINSIAPAKFEAEEPPRFPEVRRDLSMILPRNVSYEALEKTAFAAEKHFLKRISLFDVYEGEKISPGKKSYAVSFYLHDKIKTLTDAEIDKVMERIMNAYEKELNAEIRKK